MTRVPFFMVQVIEFGELDKPTVRFLRQVLTKLLKETDPEDLATIFGRSAHCLVFFLKNLEFQRCVVKMNTKELEITQSVYSCND